VREVCVELHAYWTKSKRKCHEVSTDTKLPNLQRQYKADEKE